MNATQPTLRAVQFGYEHRSVFNPWHAFQDGQDGTLCGRSVLLAAVGMEDRIPWDDFGDVQRCKSCIRAVGSL